MGLLFFALSLSPTLLPRAGWAQGAITAISTMLGVAVGELLACDRPGPLARRGRDVPRPLGAWGRRVFAAVAVVVVVAGLIWWIGSQNDQRDLVLMEHIGAGSLPVLVVASVVVAAILFFIGRTVAHFVRRLDEAVTSAVPRWAAIGVVVVAVVAFGTVVSRDVVWKQFVDWANSTYGTFDDETPPDIVQPTSPLRSGSPESLVPWDTLGYEGRNFAGGGPTVAQIQDFAGAGTAVEEPIRVYAGLQSADGQEAQAQLAVDELERTGAFDRSVLAVVTVTGTGWVDPVAAASLEYMHHGDTAIVGTQYSYLPSWISFLVDLDKAEENGRVLVDAVTQRWEQLPEATRPELLIYGISLGSYGSEHAYVGSDPAASVDAAYATGPTACSGRAPPSSTRSGSRSSTGATPGLRPGTRTTSAGGSSPSWAPRTSRRWPSASAPTATSCTSPTRRTRSRGRASTPSGSPRRGWRSRVATTCRRAGCGRRA